MKKIFIILLASIAMISCMDLEEMNIDPNRPVETHPKLLLTSIMWNTFRENPLSALYASRYLVASDGENREQVYKWTRGNFDYYNNLKDVVKMQEEAEKINAQSYLALAKYFRAHYFYKLTLNFGDIPYSEALKGESEKIFSPKYDSQETVLKGILKELKEADEILSTQQDFIEGDIVYDGNPQQWRKAINGFRLKVLMSLSKKAGQHNEFRDEFTTIANNLPLMQSIADNAQLVYIDKQGNRYPQFNNSSFGSGMYMDSTFIAVLATREDPRLLTFCTQTRNAQDAGLAIDDYSSYDGGDPAAPYATVNLKAVAGNISKPHDRFYSNPVNEPQIIVGYSEQELILAEAILRGWIQGDATVHYNNAIAGSFKFYRDNVKEYDQYLNESAVEKYIHSDLIRLEGSTEQQIEKIITQRYIQSYFQGAWTPYFEHLRTSYPKFRNPAGTTAPFRWMYPQAEYNNNRNNVEQAIKTQFANGEDEIRELVWWLK